ncbi:MAG: glutaredoxin family protein, partial [Gallionella sp.]|nr:glutaredoxin family protein [Gallionella sp.]
MKAILFLLSFFLSAQSQAGELYRSIDSSGKVHYSDRPLAGTEDVERLKLGSEPTPDEGLPYETQKAKQFFPVTLYVFDECGTPCKEARQLLKDRGIPFTEKNLVTKEEMDEFRKSSQSNQAPAMTLGKAWVRGFLASEW